MIKLNPINNRYKRLIKDHGDIWLVMNGPKSMNCFGGDNGVTCQSLRNKQKISNFKNDEVIWISA